MKTPIQDRDLTKEPPHSPRDRFGGFAILGRTIDKCRASITGNLGDFHFDCPLDKQLFGFKGIDASQFKTFVAKAQTYEDVAAWLQKTGTPRTPEEIRAWSDKVEANTVKNVTASKPAGERNELLDSCRQLGLDTETVTLFAWLEADDEASFEPHETHSQAAR
jgi:hypothetical protein